MQEFTKDFHAIEKHFFSLISLNCLNLKTIISYESSVLLAGLNPAFVKKIDLNFFKDQEMCKSYYDKKNLPWTLIVPECELLYSNQGNILTEEYELEDIGVGMVFNLLSHQLIKQQEPLEFKEMNQNLETWSIPLIDGFNSTAEITNTYILRHKEALKKSNTIHHFSGFFEGEVVVSLTLTVNGYHARIDDLATLTNFQKCGFASSLVSFALMKAIDLKVQQCFLEASNAGLNLYRRIGFQPLLTNHYYELK